VSIQQFSIIESTLREGEQFANAFFSQEQKGEIAKRLDDFGVEYLELTSPAAYPQSHKDIEFICGLDLNAKILTHTRCHMDDARLAVETGVDGIDILFGTSSILREFSHGKDIQTIVESAQDVIRYIKSFGLEVRFSSEDSFRSELVDLLTVYRAVDALGVDRVGIADTVGVARPLEVYELVNVLRSMVSCDIEFHGHNDTGCAIANSYCALEAGATHVDTSVLGIGERNGITPLGGLVARLYAENPDLVKEKYDLPLLVGIDSYVANIVGVSVPFSNYITGATAFTHKAGIHAKAMINSPKTYEILDPKDFGLQRYIDITNRLAGWNGIKERASQLNLHLSDEEVKAVTNRIKDLSYQMKISLEDVDQLLKDAANLGQESLAI
jgi:homocitrate synthase